jgi:hypothetical protein
MLDRRGGSLQVETRNLVVTNLALTFISPCTGNYQSNPEWRV